LTALALFSLTASTIASKRGFIGSHLPLGKSEWSISTQVARHRPSGDISRNQYEQGTQNVFQKLNRSLSVRICWFAQLAYQLLVVLTVGMPCSINTANRNEPESPVTICEMRGFAARLE
jgi:hypothetical protein